MSSVADVYPLNAGKVKASEGGVLTQNIWHQSPGNQFVTGSVHVAVDAKVGFLGKVVLERYDSDRSIIFEMLAQ